MPAGMMVSELSKRPLVFGFAPSRRRRGNRDRQGRAMSARSAADVNGPRGQGGCRPPGAGGPMGLGTGGGGLRIVLSSRRRPSVPMAPRRWFHALPPSTVLMDELISSTDRQAGCGTWRRVAQSVRNRRDSAILRPERFRVREPCARWASTPPAADSAEHKRPGAGAGLPRDSPEPEEFGGALEWPARSPLRREQQSIDRVFLL